jgi:hypothetical protein
MYTNIGTKYFLQVYFYSTNLNNKLRYEEVYDVDVQLLAFNLLPSGLSFRLTHVVRMNKYRISKK